MEFLEFWHWLAFGLALIVAEVFVFGAILLWLGISALIVGVLVFLVPTLLWVHSVLIWSALSVALIAAWHFYRKKYPAKNTAPTINRRGEQIVGRHFTLTKDIVNCTGELHVDDTRWKIVSYKDIPAGMKVKVVAVEGTSLRVEEYIS
jgi:inner membrane protein